MKLKDIRNNLQESLNVSDSENTKKYELVGDESESFKDIATDKKNINLVGKSKIILDAKTDTPIDALEKKPIISQKISLESTSKILKIPKIDLIEKIPDSKKINEKIIGNIYFIFFLGVAFFLGAFLYKDLLEKYLTYSYETLSYVKDDFPNYAKVKENIEESKSGFLVTKYLFKPISFLRTQSIKDADRLISGGQHLTDGFEKLSRIGFDGIILTEEKPLGDILFSHFLDNSREGFFGAMDDMRKAYNYYDDIRDLGEDDLNDKLVFLKENISSIVEKGTYLEDNYDTLLSILGHTERKKYMIVFQNSDEIRAQGGFMGSVGFIEVFGGKIESFEKKDIYALEWEANKNPYREPAPEGIDKLTGTFGLRDANYYISSGTSSQKILEILQRANIQIDGVIYANMNLAKDLLDSIGGFESKVLGVKVDGDNFPLIMSSLVESKKTREATLDSPKDILFDFIDELITYLNEEKDYKLYSRAFIDALESRDLFMNSFDEDAQKFLSYIKADGEIDYGSTLDYNYPVFTSISGNKSDRYVERSYTKTINMYENCEINTRLNIKSRHNFSLADERDAINVFDKYDIDIEENLFIQGLGNNKQFVRIVIPKEAIVKNKNVVIQNYPNTRVVEFYMDTPRFESSYFVLNYVLENPECRDYDYTFYKQPGIHNYNFQFNSINENVKFTGIRQDFEYKLQ